MDNIKDTIKELESMTSDEIQKLSTASLIIYRIAKLETQHNDLSRTVSGDLSRIKDDITQIRINTAKADELEKRITAAESDIKTNLADSLARIKEDITQIKISTARMEEIDKRVAASESEIRSTLKEHSRWIYKAIGIGIGAIFILQNFVAPLVQNAFFKDKEMISQKGNPPVNPGYFNLPTNKP